MRVLRLDHFVLTVRDIARTIDFYTRMLGMEEVTFGDGRKALRFGEQKINLHATDHPVDPNVLHATPGSADFCLIAEGELDQIVSELHTAGVPIILGPVTRTGALGPMQSIYFYDPDENLVEVASYDRIRIRPGLPLTARSVAGP
jgi:catechol 2,3-dioxygenase-like lactoylglutathione lyase family enzyme